MPRTAFPLTPVSSTDIVGQDGTKQLQQLQTAFELPPSAMDNRPPAGSDARNVKVNIPNSPPGPQASPRAPYPIQPSEAVKSRRRTSSATGNSKKDDNFELPPPPTRSRKIIQMKPQTQDDKRRAEKPAGGKGSATTTTTTTTTTSSSSSSSTKKTLTSTAEAAPGPARKKQPSGTSAASRKVSRKTAHSLIERRRRSKMNEEFGVLKDMIPACTGEMHKLAILQASIDYVKYLQDCIEKLKAQREASQTPPMKTSGMPMPSGQEPYYTERPCHQDHPNGEQPSPDVEMTGSGDASPPTLTTQLPTPSMSSTMYNNNHHHKEPSASPSLVPQDSVRRHDSYSSVSSTDAGAEYHRRYSYSYSYGSAATSPASAGYHGVVYAPGTYPAASGSTLTSPALDPLRERDLDQEATVALLMLNCDRRGTVSSMGGGTNGGGGGGGTGRGMSVRDLLSA
ncbi:Transcriptional regulator [Cytospora mali]|uniref:Transcriptional regulator n=1 Tax=Cytospora mali TaxID=578113 RepID=A0A194V8Q7_CYTMA|nr:Transcriptional regulator [Valsa mali var. pyri (nom. inval.)]